MLTGRTRHRSRPARASDMSEMFGKPHPATLRAWSLEADGRVVAMAGYFMSEGKAVVFSDIKEDVPKMTIWREAKRFMERLKVPSVCVATDESGPFLERLGWVFVGHSEDGEVYTWQV